MPIDVSNVSIVQLSATIHQQKVARFGISDHERPPRVIQGRQVSCSLYAKAFGQAFPRVRPLLIGKDDWIHIEVGSQHFNVISGHAFKNDDKAGWRRHNSLQIHRKFPRSVEVLPLITEWVRREL
jgi:hypothetical protein